MLSSGTGSSFNLTEHDRTLLDFRPITVAVDETTPITYNVSIADNKNHIVFSRTFFALNNDLQLELIAANNTVTAIVYGPDFSDPITGAYHVQANFLKPNTNYEITTEITAIGSQIPENKISDTFDLRVTS